MVSRASGLEKELHLDTGDLDHVVIRQLMGLGIENIAVDDGELGAFDMGDEKPWGRRAMTAT